MLGVMLGILILIAVWILPSVWVAKRARHKGRSFWLWLVFCLIFSWLPLLIATAIIRPTQIAK